MDGLALLCNLHADGPLSLRRLRESGVRALDELGQLPEQTLAATLMASPSQVRRFQHEGRLLSRRLKEQPLESEFSDEAPIPGEVRARLLKHVVRRPVGYDTNPPEELELPEDVAAKEPVHRHEPAPPSSTGSPAAEIAHEAERLRPTRDEGPTLFDTEPEPPRASPVSIEGTPLRSGTLPGLDSRTCQRLVAQGVRTYKALVDLANLNLARRTGIPFTRLLDLRHHARAYLQVRLMPAAAPTRPPEASRERPVELVPLARRIPEPPRALRMERVPQELPRTLGTPEPRESVRSDEPGVAGPFV